MTPSRTLPMLAALAMIALAIPGCRRESAPHDEEAHGPHGGWWLAGEPLSFEVTIHEAGVPPEFRVYPFEGETPVDPRGIDMVIHLDRLGGRRDRIAFAPEGEYLRGDAVVDEPHSFDVMVDATRSGQAQVWRYATYEGRVELLPAVAARAGIRTAPAEPATIRTTRVITGQIAPNEDRLAHVVPRFPGIVRDVRKALGDRVVKGETVGVVQSNESLQPYELVAPLSGTIVRKHAIVGEFVGQDDALFVVADLSSVWVDLAVHRHDFGRLRAGQSVVVSAGDVVEPVTGTITWVSPLGAPSTQTMLARVELPNPDGSLLPGLFVVGEVVVDEAVVPVAVPGSALQTFRDWDVVFIQVGDTYEVRPVTVGRRDGALVEVVTGLAAGERIVVAQAFVLKAELGKSGASHDH